MSNFCKKVLKDRVEWYQNNLLHREDGPAIEYANGDKHWYKNDKWHREDGPAVEFINGDKLYTRIIGNYHLIIEKDYTIICYKGKEIIINEKISFNINENNLKKLLLFI